MREFVFTPDNHRLSAPLFRSQADVLRRGIAVVLARESEESLSPAVDEGCPHLRDVVRTFAVIDEVDDKGLEVGVLAEDYEGDSSCEGGVNFCGDALRVRELHGMLACNVIVEDV